MSWFSKKEENNKHNRAELNPADAREAVVYLAEKANEFFEQEYHDSDEIHSIIKIYSELLAKRHMDILNGRHTINEVIKPLCLYSDKLTDWVFTTIRSSLMKKFPYRSDYIRQAFTMYDDDTEKIDVLMDAVCYELSHKLKSGFVMDLWQSMKEHYKRVLQNNYPFEYNLLTSNEKWIGGVWDELYGRSVKVIYDCLKNFGLEIPPLPDKEKIIFNKIEISNDGTAPINVSKNAIFGSIITKIEQTERKMDKAIKVTNKKNEVRKDISTRINGKNDNIEVVNEGNKAENIIIDIGNDENILPAVEDLILEIKKSNLETANQLIGLLLELTQAIKSNDTKKQTETKDKFSGFWLAVGSTVQKVLQSSANLTRVLEYLGIKLLLN